jgi:hypothetical protein
MEHMVHSQVLRQLEPIGQIAGTNAFEHFERSHITWCQLDFEPLVKLEMLHAEEDLISWLELRSRLSMFVSPLLLSLLGCQEALLGFGKLLTPTTHELVDLGMSCTERCNSGRIRVLPIIEHERRVAN